MLGKITILVLLILAGCDFSHNTVQSPKTTIDSLQKYSYLIYGIYNVHQVNNMVSFDANHGTCFFIKQSGKTYLVSAKHVLTCWDADSARKRPYPDTLRIRLFSKYTGDTVYYPIVIKGINDTITGGYFYEEPDVFVIEFKAAQNYEINSIESFIDTVSVNSTDTIASFGFPFSLPLTNLENMVKLISQSSQLTTGLYSTKQAFPFSLMDSRYDNFDYGLKRTDTFFKGGCSGSPLFQKNIRTGSWSFAGIFSKASYPIPACLIVRPENVLRKLAELQRKTN